MESNKVKELKKGIKKILWENTTINQKYDNLGKLKKELNLSDDIQIGLANDGIGVFGIFVSEKGKPLFADTTPEFLNQMKKNKKEFYEKLDKITSQVMLSTEKIKEEILELGKEYQVNIEVNEKNQIIIDKCVGTSWLFFAEF